MIIYETKTFEYKEVTKIVCDRCKREITPADNVIEWQESYTIEFEGGYGSVFGDGNGVQCDLCQRCLKELIGDFCVYNGEV